MKLNPSFSRFLSVLLWLTAAVLATVALNELLHRSKEPEVLFWSTKKLAFCLGVFIASMACFWTSKKLAVQGFPKPLEHSAAPFFVFLTISCLWFVLHMGTTPEVAGDIQYQMLGFRQYLEGVTTQINTQVVPIVDQDLAKDRIMPIVWYPPGPMWLLLPFTFLGLSPDWAARCLIFLGFLTGGMGFLVLAVRLGFTHKACLAFALVLALWRYVRKLWMR